MNIAKRIFFMLTLQLMFALQAAEPSTKKVIHFGWSVPRVLKYYQSISAEEFEKYFPFDGIGISPYMQLERDGKQVVYMTCGTSSKDAVILVEEDIQDWIDTFKKLQFKKLQHNFFGVNTSPFSGDWFDEKAWQKVLNNHRLICRLARKSGFKGVSFDPEAYRPPQTDQPFAYRNDSEKTFSETASKVRQRGREYMQVLAAEYPDMTLFTFLIADFYHRNAGVGDNATVSLMALYPAFVNGLLDALPEGITIIDGNEWPGYNAATECDFAKCTADYYRFAMKETISQENYGKFRNQVLLGYSLYLDSFVPNMASYENWKKSKYQVRLLYDAMVRAVELTDQYVWVWAEKGAFLPKDLFPSRFADWDTILPGVREAIAAGSDQLKSARKIAAPENLLLNGLLRPGAGEARNNGPDTIDFGIPGWSSWQDDRVPRGNIVADEHGIKFTKVVNGSIVQSFQDYIPGDLFLITAQLRSSGDGMKPSLSCSFRDVNGQGLWKRSLNAEFGPPDNNGLRHAEMLAQIPMDVETSAMTVGCGVRGSHYTIPEESFCRFEEVKLQRVIYPWWNWTVP